MGRWDQYLYNKRIGNASAAEGALQGRAAPPHPFTRRENRRVMGAPSPDLQVQARAPGMEQGKGEQNVNGRLKGVHMLLQTR